LTIAPATPDHRGDTDQGIELRDSIIFCAPQSSTVEVIGRNRPEADIERLS
jgi:hypothetical protein